MRNALAIYDYHLPVSERGKFLALLLPNLWPWKRLSTLVPSYTHLTQQTASALRALRPRAARYTRTTLNAADLAARIAPNRRDTFIVAALGARATQAIAPRGKGAHSTLFDLVRDDLRNLSNEDPRVLRAVDRCGVDPYDAPWELPPNSAYADHADYIAELRRHRTYEEQAMAEADCWSPKPRAFRHLSEVEFAYQARLQCGYPPDQAWADAEATVRSRETNRATRAAMSPDEQAAYDREQVQAYWIPAAKQVDVPNPTPAASIHSVETIRRDNEIQILRDQRAALTDELKGQQLVIENLEADRAAARQRVADLEAAQERTRRAFDDLRRAEQHRADAYFGGRRSTTR